MAAATPMGTEAMSAQSTSATVPMRAGKMPPAVMPDLGYSVRKSQVR